MLLPSAAWISRCCNPQNHNAHFCVSWSLLLKLRAVWMWDTRMEMDIKSDMQPVSIDAKSVWIFGKIIIVTVMDGCIQLFPYCIWGWLLELFFFFLFVLPFSKNLQLLPRLRRICSYERVSAVGTRSNASVHAIQTLSHSCPTSFRENGKMKKNKTKQNMTSQKQTYTCTK